MHPLLARLICEEPPRAERFRSVAIDHAGMEIQKTFYDGRSSSLLRFVGTHLSNYPWSVRLTSLGVLTQKASENIAGKLRFRVEVGVV